MLLALLLALIHPAIVQTIAVDDASTQHVFNTYIRGRFNSFGYSGVLRFRIQDGFVNGTYRPDTGGTLTQVHGGVRGSNIWFDIPTLGGMHINATMEADGSIRGMGSSRTGGGWVFTATPLSSS